LTVILTPFAELCMTVNLDHSILFFCVGSLRRSDAGDAWPMKRSGECQQAEHAIERVGSCRLSAGIFPAAATWMKSVAADYIRFI
jgi:hypothetical protein